MFPHIRKFEQTPVTIDKKFILLLGLGILLFGANLGGLSIYILDEAKNCSCAREMLERMDFFRPTFNYQLRTDKPPLHYFFMMLSYKMFGVNEFSARFFSAFFGTATVLSTYLFVKKYIDKNTAFWSAIVLLSSIQVVIQFHQAVPDPYLVFFFTAGMFLFYSFYSEQNRRNLYLAYVCLGLGLLTKGPVILVLAGLSLLLFLLVQKQVRKIWEFKPLQGLAIALAISVPWYIAAGKATDGVFLSSFFLKHNLERFSQPMEGHGGPFFLVPVYIIWGLFPFSIFIIQAVRFTVKRHQPVLSYSLCIGLVACCFFMLSGTKLPNYPAPCFPFVAVVLGHFLTRARVFDSNYRLTWSLLFYLLFTIALPIAVYLVLEDLLKMPDLGYLAYWFLVLTAGAVAAILFLYQKDFHWSARAISFSWIVFILVFFYVVFPPMDRQNPVSEALYLMDKKKPVFYFERYNPAFSFYLQKEVHRLPSLSDPPQGEAYILSRKKNVSPDPALTSYKIVAERKEMFEPHTTIVLYADTDTTSSKQTSKR